MPTFKQLKLRTDQATLVGKGLTSDVYQWGEDRVLKLFHPPRRAEKVESEFLVTQALYKMGLAVPEAFELVEMEGRLGIVFEKIEGRSLFMTMESKPWRWFWGAGYLAELHAHLHTHTGPEELPTQFDQINGWIERAADFSEAEKQAARDCLARMPQGNVVCHGDFHPENVLLTARGPVIIDWSTGTRGNALSDVCRTCLLFETAEIPKSTPVAIRLLINLLRRVLLRIYLKRYLELRPATVGEINAWRPAQLAGSSVWRTTGVM